MILQGPGRGLGARRPEAGRPRSLADEVLHLIWEQRRISRAEIARRTDLSRSTVSEVAATLLATRLVAEAGVGDSRGGRRPIVLEFQDDACVILGLDIGATHVAAVLTNLRGKILAWEHGEHPVRSDPDGTLAIALEFCRRCLKRWGGPRQRLVGIGIAVPSPVDPEHPDRFSPIAMPAWRGRGGFPELVAEFGVPVLVDNDANLGALAEHWWGAGRGVADFAFIKVATGIGLGHLMEGRIYRGARGVAGEISHLSIDPQGEPCGCGNRGCLVTFVGTAALLAHAERLRKTYPKSVLATGALTIARIEDAALAGDALALAVVAAAAEHLGVAIAGLLNLTNPAAVILGGGLTRLGDRLVMPLRETVRQRTFVEALAASDIVTSQLGPQGIAVGAATLILDAALAAPAMFPTGGRR